MKKNIFRITQIFLFLTVIIFATSCANDKRNLKSETYKSGAEIIEKMISTYRQMADVSYTSKYKQELVSILSSTPTLRNEDITFSENSMEMIIALGTLKKVYQKYDLISDKNFNVKTAGIGEAVIASCQALDSLEISEEVSKELAIITDYISASNFDEKLVIGSLTEQYINVWQKDVAKWQLLLIEAYSKYAEGIDNIATETFDEEKLAKFVYEPYSGKDVMVDVYKLNLKNEAFKEKETISKNLEDLTWGLENINLINAEFSKNTPDELYIEQIIDKVNEYLLLVEKPI